MPHVFCEFWGAEISTSCYDNSSLPWLNVVISCLNQRRSPSWSACRSNKMGICFDSCTITFSSFLCHFKENHQHLLSIYITTLTSTRMDLMTFWCILYKQHGLFLGPSDVCTRKRLWPFQIHCTLLIFIHVCFLAVATLLKWTDICSVCLHMALY